MSINKRQKSEILFLLFWTLKNCFQMSYFTKKIRQTPSSISLVKPLPYLFIYLISIQHIMTQDVTFKWRSEIKIHVNMSGRPLNGFGHKHTKCVCLCLGMKLCKKCKRASVSFPWSKVVIYSACPQQTLIILWHADKPNFPKIMKVEQTEMNFCRKDQWVHIIIKVIPLENNFM